jgi:competence protein ComGC
MKKINNKGFTIAEVIVVITFIFCIIFVIGFISKGNYWFSEDGVLKKIKLNHPKATKVIDTEREAWNYSIITVIEDGVRKKYYLDTDILWNYKIYETDD